MRTRPAGVAVGGAAADSRLGMWEVEWLRSAADAGRAMRGVAAGPAKAAAAVLRSTMSSSGRGVGGPAAAAALRFWPARADAAASGFLP